MRTVPASIPELIEALGGGAEVARALGIPPSTVFTWSGRASIPYDRWPAIIDEAARRGVEGIDANLILRISTSPAPSPSSPPSEATQ